jgi:hypothetical protein
MRGDDSVPPFLIEPGPEVQPTRPWTPHTNNSTRSEKQLNRWRARGPGRASLMTRLGNTAWNRGGISLARRWGSFHDVACLDARGDAWGREPAAGDVQRPGRAASPLFPGAAEAAGTGGGAAAGPRRRRPLAVLPAAGHARSWLWPTRSSRAAAICSGSRPSRRVAARTAALTSSRRRSTAPGTAGARQTSTSTHPCARRSPGSATPTR